jgi:hypothetical protein
MHDRPERRELLADGQPIKLGGRAFDVLMGEGSAGLEAVPKELAMRARRTALLDLS